MILKKNNKINSDRVAHITVYNFGILGTKRITKKKCIIVKYMYNVNLFMNNSNQSDHSIYNRIYSGNKIFNWFCIVLNNLEKKKSKQTNNIIE